MIKRFNEYIGYELLLFLDKNEFRISKKEYDSKLYRENEDTTDYLPLSEKEMESIIRIGIELKTRYIQKHTNVVKGPVVPCYMIEKEDYYIYLTKLDDDYYYILLALYEKYENYYYRLDQLLGLKNFLKKLNTYD